MVSAKRWVHLQIDNTLFKGMITFMKVTDPLARDDVSHLLERSTPPSSIHPLSYIHHTTSLCIQLQIISTFSNGVR